MSVFVGLTVLLAVSIAVKPDPTAGVRVGLLRVGTALNVFYVKPSWLSGKQFNDKKSPANFNRCKGNQLIKNKNSNINVPT